MTKAQVILSVYVVKKARGEPEASLLALRAKMRAACQAKNRGDESLFNALYEWAAEQEEWEEETSADARRGNAGISE